MSDKLPPRILIIEYKSSISISYSNLIERAGFDLERTNNLDRAVVSATIHPPNIVIVDSWVKGTYATKIVNKIRFINNYNLSKVPVIFILEPHVLEVNYTLENNDLVSFLYKPFTLEQLMSLIRSLLRRSQLMLQDKIIKYKNVSMNLANYKVYVNDTIIHLGPTEFEILQLFMQLPKTIFSRQKIIEYIWGNNSKIDERTIDVYINRIRTALIQDKNTKQVKPFIKTVRAMGYCLDLPEINYKFIPTHIEMSKVNKTTSYN